MKNIKKKGLFVLVLLLAVFLRFQNLNWDANMHLHPDERFLTMVGIALKMPASLTEYLNSAVSTWNPGNVGYPFFVYGLFPITINKLIALLLHTDSYNTFTIQGRFLSGIADMFALLFVYKMGILLKKRFNLSSLFPVFSAFLYAVAVYPIQSSHFFTTDTFLNTFLIISCYASLSFYFEKKTSQLIVSSLFLGLAFSSKISAIYMFPIIVLMIAIPLIKKKNMLHVVLHFCIYLFVLYGVIRMASPYYFETGDIFNLTPNQQFLKNIVQLQYLSSDKMFFPPNIQWYSKVPILFSLFNLSFFGTGLLFFIGSCTGCVLFIRASIKGLASKRTNKIDILLGFIIVLWMIGYFLYISIQFVKSIRYLIFLFPFLSLFGGYCFSMVQRKKVIYVIVLLLLLWPILFSTIYLQENTRVAASKWIYKKIPNNSIILTEYWDDPLPLPVSANKRYNIEPMSVFDVDTSEKWNKMHLQLAKSDYYVLSSNRGWASISTIPKKYPKMSIFYADLFDGKTNYSLVATFIPSYQFILPFHPKSWINNWFEEAFTVYDHPSVFIFKRIK